MSNDLMTELRTRGLTDYCSVIPGPLVREVLGIEYPTKEYIAGMDVYDVKRILDSLALEEMSAIDYVRGALLNEGKYLTFERGDYRILSPEQNSRQVESYIASATRKLNRARKLNHNTPKGAAPHSEQLNARIALKLRSGRHRGA